MLNPDQVLALAPPDQMLMALLHQMMRPGIETKAQPGNLMTQRLYIYLLYPYSNYSFYDYMKCNN
jgi:hypothetical protein